VCAELERLAQAETVFGRVMGIDIPGGKLWLETGGSSHDEGRAGTGAMSSLTLYIDDKTNLDQMRAVGTGDDISVQVVEATSPGHEFGVGHKLVREIYVFRGNEKLAGDLALRMSAELRRAQPPLSAGESTMCSLVP